MFALMTVTLSLASEPTYMERFASTGAQSAPRKAEPTATQTTAVPVLADSVVAAESVQSAENVDLAAPTVDAVVRIESVAAETDPRLAELQATIASLQARLDANEAASAEAKVKRPPPDVGVSATLGVASAYVFRGANYFNSTQNAPAALVAPAIEAGIGDVTIGWWSGYQATGSDRDAFVRGGNGHEQDLYVGWGTELAERVAVSGQLTGYWYPFSVAEEAGADAALWIEPSVAVDVDAGVTLSGSAAWYQGAQAGIAQRSYAYMTAGLAHSVPILHRTSMDLGAVAGFKAPKDAAQWPYNTVDVTLSWGVGWEGESFSLTPAGHLTWTNLKDVDPGSETLLWFGLDTSVKL